MENERHTFEERLNRVEKIVEKMEGENLSMEEGFIVVRRRENLGPLLGKRIERSKGKNGGVDEQAVNY